MNKNFQILFLFSLFLSLNAQEKTTDEGLEEAKDLSDDYQSFYNKLLYEKQQEDLKQKRIQLGLKEKLDYSEFADEKQNWIFDNRQKVIYALVCFVFSILVLLIGWKMYEVSKANKLKTLKLEKQAQQMEDILTKKQDNDKVRWDEQKGKIEFIKNPSYKDSQNNQISKVDKLQQELQNLEQEQSQKEKEIQELEETAQKYIDEIQELKQLYEENKKKVLQEGVPLGYADTVLREFK